MKCATPTCTHKANAGLFTRFCKPCAKNLARIRDEFETETHAYDPRTNRAIKRGPICCAAGCNEPRPPGQAYCAVCRSMGVGDEEAA